MSDQQQPVTQTTPAMGAPYAQPQPFPPPVGYPHPHAPQPQPMVIIHNNNTVQGGYPGPLNAPPARTAHGPLYWILIGWWWAPLKWIGRVALWLFLFPVGVWRSWTNHAKKKEARERRGYKKSQR